MLAPASELTASQNTLFDIMLENNVWEGIGGKSAVDRMFFAHISPFHFLPPTTTLAPHRHRPRGSPMTCLSTQPLNACFGVVLWMYGIGTKRSVPEKK